MRRGTTPAGDVVFDAPPESITPPPGIVVSDAALKSQ